MKKRIALLVGVLIAAAVVSVGLSALVVGAAASSDSTKTPLQEFIPTEKVPADHPISFPVDI